MNGQVVQKLQDVWDAADAKSDITLQSVLSIAKAISVRARETDDLPVDPEEMEVAIRRIERQVQRLQDIRTKSTTIRSGAEAIVDIATKMEAEIGLHLSVLDISVQRLKSLEDEQ